MGLVYLPTFEVVWGAQLIGSPMGVPFAASGTTGAVRTFDRACRGRSIGPKLRSDRESWTNWARIVGRWI